MNEKIWEKKLRDEGFTITYVWEDGPNVFYPNHTHSSTTAHIILSGEMTVITEGSQQTIKEGGRFDVPAQAIHSARMGPHGCRYLIGEK